MAYKNKDKQREAGRARARRYRENRQKALLSEGVTDTKCESNVGVTDIGVVEAGVIVRDPEIIQTATQEAAKVEQNEKS